MISLAAVLFSGCNSNLFTGDVVADGSFCQDVQIPYYEEAPVERVVEIEREEVQFKPEPYVDQHCQMVDYAYTVLSEQVSGWSELKPYCHNKIEVVNQEDTVGTFDVYATYLLQSARNEQRKSIRIGAGETVTVEFLAQCQSADVITFDHATIIPPKMKKCSSVTKYRSVPITRMVKSSEIVTQMEQVAKFKIERKCE